MENHTVFCTSSPLVNDGGNAAHCRGLEELEMHRSRSKGQKQNKYQTSYNHRPVTPTFMVTTHTKVLGCLDM